MMAVVVVVVVVTGTKDGCAGRAGRSTGEDQHARSRTQDVWRV